MFLAHTTRRAAALVKAVTALPLMVVMACTLAGCGPAVDPPPTFHPSTPAEAAALTYFQSQVKPVLRSNCYRCHWGMNHKGDFNMGTREAALKGGKNGIDIVPGHPDQSRLMTAVRRQGDGVHPKPMPPKDSLEDSEIRTLEKWIADGAIMDR